MSVFKESFNNILDEISEKQPRFGGGFVVGVLVASATALGIKLLQYIKTDGMNDYSIRRLNKDKNDLVLRIEKIKTVVNKEADVFDLAVKSKRETRLPTFEKIEVLKVPVDLYVEAMMVLITLKRHHGSISKLFENDHFTCVAFLEDARDLCCDLFLTNVRLFGMYDYKSISGILDSIPKGYISLNFKENTDIMNLIAEHKEG